MKRLFMLLIAFSVLLSCAEDVSISASKSDDSDVTAYYTVTYDGNNQTSGDPPIDNLQYAKDWEITIKSNSGNLTKTGSTFVGWNTKADGSGITYTPLTIILAESSNIILYAKWSANSTYTVVYNSNLATSGSVPIDNTNYEQNQTVVVRSNSGSLVKTGSTFVGWNTQSNGLGTSYTQDQTFSMGTSNVILYAKWSVNPTYTVTYYYNDSTSGTVPTDSVSYETGANVSVKTNSGNLTKYVDGFTWVFVGWNTQSNGLGTDYDVSSNLVMGSTNVNLYAKYTAIGAFVMSGGGTIFYDKGSYSGTPSWRYISYNTAVTGIQKKWGCSSSMISGMAGASVGAGKQNTEAIDAQCTTNDIAADYAIKFTYSSFSDWYLPSLNELATIYNNIHLNGQGNFLTTSLGYLSSTQLNTGNASAFTFFNGTGYSLSKDTNCNILVVRYF